MTGDRKIDVPRSAPRTARLDVESILDNTSALSVRLLLR